MSQRETDKNPKKWFVEEMFPINPHTREPIATSRIVLHELPGWTLPILECTGLATPFRLDESHVIDDPNSYWNTELYKSETD